jgi:hypothetical protein
VWTPWNVYLRSESIASLLRDLQALAERQDDSAAFRKRFFE